MVTRPRQSVPLADEHNRVRKSHQERLNKIRSLLAFGHQLKAVTILRSWPFQEVGERESDLTLRGSSG